MILTVSSKLDAAGTNIARHLLQKSPFEETGRLFQGNPVYAVEVGGRQVAYATLEAEETVYAQALPASFPDTELVVFLSQHSSQSGKPTLSVHTPGNLAEAEMGGLPRRVSVAAATAMRDALQALDRLRLEMGLGYEVSYECTHHGPSLDVPTMFVELGSSPAQWRDQRAAAAVAEAAMEAISKFRTSQAVRAALGIGGTHYNQKFTRMALEGEAAFGHMITKYALPRADYEILQQCVKRTLEKVDCAVLDWKGIRGEDKLELLSLLQEIGLPVEKA